jgi:hypothetical protein
MVGVVLTVSALLAACGGSPSPATTTSTTTPALRVDATTAPWQLGAPVSRAVALVSGSDVVVLGGLATGDTSTSTVWQLAPGSGTATRVGSLARAVHDAAGALLGGRCVVFGGGAASTVADVQAWTSGVGAQVIGTLPQPRSDLAAVTVGTTAYVLGGFDGTAMAPDILATTDGVHFASVGRLAVPVRYPAVAVADGAMWIVGGQLGTGESSAVGGQSDAIQRFDLRSHKTTLVGHLPVTLGHASALVLGGHVLVLGGDVGTTPSAQIWAIDTTSGAPSQVGTLPGARSDAAAAVVGGVGYLFGGEDVGPTAPLQSVVVVRVGG